MQVASFINFLAPYKILIEEHIRSHLDTFGQQTNLKEACTYALMNGGKRFRPALVFLIANALGHQADVTQAALGVEFFHTASLIADDLPCMDNDDERRNKPTLHKVYGETTALLATYALIAAGYACLARNGQVIKNSSLPFASKSDELCVLALENVAHNTGILGATGGQFLDINPTNLSLETLEEIIFKKTVSLFEISFVLGWVFGGGNLAQLPLVKKSAKHFGLAFQIVDDIEDMNQDLKNQRFINVANQYGLEKAKQLLEQEVQAFKETLSQLNIHSQELITLLESVATKSIS